MEFAETSFHKIKRKIWETIETGLQCTWQNQRDWYFQLLHFSKTWELWSSKDNWHLRFLLQSIFLADLSGNKTLLQRVQKVMVCVLWMVDFNPFCVFRLTAAKNAIVKADFELQSSHVCEKCSKLAYWFCHDASEILPICDLWRSMNTVNICRDIRFIHCMHGQVSKDLVTFPLLSLSLYCSMSQMTRMYFSFCRITIILIIFSSSYCSAI